MLLLDLPSEVFEIIIECLTRNKYKYTQSSNVGSYRLVCRTFNNVIIAQFLAAAGKKEICQSNANKESRYRLLLLGTDILYWKIVHNVHDHSRIEAIAKVVDELMASEWPWSTAAAEQLRLQFTRNICDAVQGFGLDGFVDFFAARKDSSPKWVKSLLPMAMAATGNVAVMTEVTTRGCTDIRGVFAIKPNVLKAAIAANQADIVDRILYFLATNTQGPRITGDWEEMRMVAREIGEALKVAVRMYRYEIGLLITGFLKRNWRTLGRSVHWSLVREIADCCIQYGNTGLFNTLSYWKRTGELPNSGTDLSYKMTKGEFTFIIRRGMSCLMRHIVKSGMVDPNLIEGEAPLWLALSARRYRMAKVLVEEGADMDRVPPGKNLTAYHHACDSYKRDDQYYLVLWGADTRPMHEHGTPWDPADKAKKVYIEEQGLHGWGEGEYISVENHVPEIQI